MSGLSKDQFADHFDVSRETMDRLERYEALIQKWNPAINLVAKSTLPDLWARHFYESAKAYEIANPKTGKWVDLGSGGGLPGLVILILAAEKAPNLIVTCIESDIRKCEFMRTVARSLDLRVNILTRRIEECPAQNAEYVSARALAPLPKLLTYINHHLNDNGVAVLHKGSSHRAEIDLALETWRFKVEKHPNTLSPDSVILKIGELSLG